MNDFLLQTWKQIAESDETNLLSTPWTEDDAEKAKPEIKQIIMDAEKRSKGNGYRALEEALFEIVDDDAILKEFWIELLDEKEVSRPEIDDSDAVKLYYTDKFEQLDIISDYYSSDVLEDAMEEIRLDKLFELAWNFFDAETWQKMYAFLLEDWA